MPSRSKRHNVFSEGCCMTYRYERLANKRCEFEILICTNTRTLKWSVRVFAEVGLKTCLILRWILNGWEKKYLYERKNYLCEFVKIYALLQNLSQTASTKATQILSWKGIQLTGGRWILWSYSLEGLIMPLALWRFNKSVKTQLAKLARVGI